MDETKQWYKSRTIIAALLGVVYAILAMFGVVPDAFTQELILEGVLVIVGLLVTYFRYKADTRVDRGLNQDNG